MGHGFTGCRAELHLDARECGESSGMVAAGAATVDAAGNAYVAWASYSKAGGARGMVHLYVARSADGGKTWSPSLLDVSAAAPGCETEECSEAYLGAQVALASDAGGTLYAVWSAGNLKMGPQRIYFSSSTNKGESWLPRVNLSYADPGVEHAFPAIAAGSNGDVRVAWMDARSAPYWNTYYRSSSNGGATWGEEIQLSGYVIGISLHREEGLPFPVRRLFRDGDRQPRRHARGLGRGIELPSAWIDPARQRALGLAAVTVAVVGASRPTSANLRITSCLPVTGAQSLNRLTVPSG